MSKKYGNLRILNYLLFTLLLLIIISPLHITASTYTPTTDKKTELGHNVVMHETKGEFTGSQSINYVTFNPVATKSIKLIPWAVLNKDTQTNTRSSVLSIGRDYELKNPGSKVIAGINADFFPFVSTNENPFSAQVIEGDLHQAYVFNESQGGTYYPANVLGIMPDGNLRSSHIVTASQATFLDIFGKDGQVVYSVQLAGFGSEPANNQTSAYFGSSYPNPITSQTSVYYVETPSYLRDDSRFGRGKISKVAPSITLAKRTFAIVTKDSKVESFLDEGVEIRVTRRIAGALEGSISAIGFYGHPLKNGEIAPYGAYPNGLGGSKTQSTWSSYQPRTMLGFKADGSVVMGIVEGRQAGKTGFTAQGVGSFLQGFDCIEGYMFDGGGSSTLVATIDGTLKQVATGTDGTCAVVNALLLVEQKTDPIDLKVRIEDIRSDSFKIIVNPNLLPGFSIDKIEAIINDISYLMTGSEFLVEGANVNESNSVSFKVTYKENGVEKVFTSLKSINVKTIAMPPEVKVTVSEITTSSITLLVTLDSNGSVILESYFSFNNDSRPLSIGKDNMFTYTNLEETTTYSYTAIVNYNDETGVKYYTFPKTNITTKSNSDGNGNYLYLVIIAGALAVSGFILIRRFKKSKSE